jgi:5-methylcytosine-specific restriction endonuclease McrA
MRLICRHGDAGASVPSIQLQHRKDAVEYACHYCGRSNGSRTKDHKVPKIFGGKGGENIVRSCLMCNMIKNSREYGHFAALFREFLDEHEEEYQAADPDDFRTIGLMHRRFNKWLHALQHGKSTEAEST